MKTFAQLGTLDSADLDRTVSSPTSALDSLHVVTFIVLMQNAVIVDFI